MAQSMLNDPGKPFFFLALAVQLVNQTVEETKLFDINTMQDVSRFDLNDDPRNGNAVVVVTYSSLSNGREKFRWHGICSPVKFGIVTLDNTHSSAPVLILCSSLRPLVGENFGSSL